MIAKTFTVTAGMLAAALLNACTAHAEPPKFPDIRGYAPVNAQDYELDTTTPGHSSKGTFFVTPDGLPCSIQSDMAGCTSDNLPGVQVQNGDKIQYRFIDTLADVRESGSTPYTNNTFRGHTIKTLPPFHSIAVGGTICGVDDAGTTACKDSQGRGFVLSPKGSGWLPKV